MHPRPVELTFEAGAALRQILGIMIDQSLTGDGWAWDLEHVVMLDSYLESQWTHDEWSSSTGETRPVELAIDDAALLLQGMAFTEVASAELPWIDMVRWTTDFVTAELRRPWTEQEWHEVNIRSR